MVKNCTDLPAFWVLVYQLWMLFCIIYKDQSPRDEWIKMWYMYISIAISIYLSIHSGILLSHKKNEIMPFAATQVDLEIIILSEVSQTKTNTI